jgi:hypothetical protein
MKFHTEKSVQFLSDKNDALHLYLHSVSLGFLHFTFCRGGKETSGGRKADHVQLRKVFQR